ncbi:ATP-binding protein [Mycoplasmopsis citelli]|uniref:AlbA family DNA-binding domain-containing protein n=1 Tax=Mycoplasmopsis citelli TaxID=171281 RepID=UPI0021142A22|nr:ATP-binding protein [Mycoplasmopsis citelli]UUD36621.1 ATP-binding protein [Mycoplasmopsis citelli]
MEFKSTYNQLGKDVYDTVCAFNNRIGGHLILLGVNDNKEIIDKNLKDFTKSINNLDKIRPKIYLKPEIIDIEDKKYLYLYSGRKYSFLAC